MFFFFRISLIKIKCLRNEANELKVLVPIYGMNGTTTTTTSGSKITTNENVQK